LCGQNQIVDVLRRGHCAEDETSETANGTDGKRTQHLALCDDGGDERQRGPRATRKHLSISASIDGGTIDTSSHSTSSTALRDSVVHLLAVVLIDVDS
jgi:hypothetical protein